MMRYIDKCLDLCSEYNGSNTAGISISSKTKRESTPKIYFEKIELKSQILPTCVIIISYDETFT